MTTSRNILFCLVICTAAGTTACATAQSNPAGDAGGLAGDSDAGGAGFDAAPVSDSSALRMDATPVCSAGNQPCATGCCPLVAPDELAPWTTGTMVATGTCQSTEVYPYSCTPSTPGRDANGCCTATINGGSSAGTLTFAITTLPDGRHQLQTSACTLTNAICEITATATEAVVGEPLRSMSASLKSTNYWPYLGQLSTSLNNGTLTIGFAGTAQDYGERCGNSIRYKSCTWTAP